MLIKLFYSRNESILGIDSFITSENMQKNVFHSVYFIRNNVMEKNIMLIPNEPPSAHFSPQCIGP